MSKEPQVAHRWHDAIDWRNGDDSQTLAAELAEWITGQLCEAVARRGQASLVVSGGSTPLPMFAALKQAEVPWDHVMVTLADERCVPPDHPDSNARLVREYLLAEGATFVPLYDEGAPPEAAARAARAVAQIPRPFDVVVLGMGEDGHTASLFPYHPALAAALAEQMPLCVAVVDAPKPPPDRLTLTRQALLASRRIVLHITGAEKRQVVEEALAGDDIAELPIRAILHQRRVPVSIWWAA